MVRQGQRSGGLFLCLMLGLLIAVPASAQYTMPGQWHPISELLWGCNDTYLVVDTYIDSIRALNGAAQSSIIVASSYVANQLRYEFQAAGVNTAAVRYYTYPVDSIWMRDYAPIFTHDSTGRVFAVDAKYYPDRPNDDRFPYAFARFRGLGYTTLNLWFEGGNIMSDGRGRLFFSNDTYGENSNYASGTVAWMIRSKIGGTSVVTPTPLLYEGTGHIDMYSKLTSATRVVVADYPAGHRQKSRVDAAAARYANLGLTVVRAQMALGIDEFGTYVNAVYANGVALVPKYYQSQDAAGLAAFANGGFRAVGVDCREIIGYGGAVHCITYGVPTTRTTR